MGKRIRSFGFLVLLSGLPVQQVGISRFNKGFDPGAVVRREKHAITFSDHIPDKSVTVCLNASGLPVAVFRTVLTEVCKKGECLPVYLKLFWTISGEYLGFEMQPGEVLTKYDHALFGTADYDRLHTLLSDPLSLLGNIEESDIAPDSASVKKQNTQTDLVSGATKRDIAPYTVAGAAYTTYTLWHLVYGETRDSIPGAVRKYLTPGLALSFLKSPAVGDKMWAVSVMDVSWLSDPALMEEIMRSYREGNRYLQEAILEALLVKGNPALVPVNYLSSFFRASAFSQRRTMLKLLEDYPEVARDFIPAVAGDLASPEPTLALLLLRLIRKSGMKSEEIREWIIGQAGSVNADVLRAAKECISYLDTH